MGKQIQSPVKRWPGYVVLPDALTWPQLADWDDSISLADAEKQAFRALGHHADGILKIVSEWHIEGLPERPTALPTKPLADAAALVQWLTTEINRFIMEGEGEDPFLSAD